MHFETLMRLLLARDDEAECLYTAKSWVAACLAGHCNNTHSNQGCRRGPCAGAYGAVCV